MKTTRLYFETVRHLSSRQIVTRAARIAERAWWRITKAKASAFAAVPPIATHQPLWRDRAPDDRSRERGREIAAGRFTFLNETRVRPEWDAPDASRLWRFHLHSFDYARDLDPDVFVEIAKSWIDSNRRLGGDGWHPYTISLRVVNWCEALMAFGDHAEIRASIYAQTRFLVPHLEYDVRGNHLLENARALVRAGAFFNEPALIALGVKVLREELPEQILPDGGHFERNPGYHLRVMHALEDVAMYVDEPWLASAIVRMQDFLNVIVPPGGRLPLLKDTTSADDEVLSGRVPQASAVHLAASGFAIARNDRHGDFLIADFGRVCPDDLPAHAHADMFSYELTIGGRPTIVDSGAFEYAEGEWRRWFRSTAAHNTVEIDGRDQSEMWGSFRVGRRARPRNIIWTDDPAFTAISGEHDGYAPLIHHRTIVALREERMWLIVDRIAGGAAHIARSFIHLHPDAEVPKIATFGAVMSETEGWYSERFGEKQRNRVLVLEATAPAWFGYVISADEVSATLTSDGDRCSIEVTATSLSVLLSLTPGRAPQFQRILQARPPATIRQ